MIATKKPRVSPESPMIVCTGLQEAAAFFEVHGHDDLAEAMRVVGKHYNNLHREHEILVEEEMKRRTTWLSTWHICTPPLLGAICIVVITAIAISIIR